MRVFLADFVRSQEERNYFTRPVCLKDCVLPGVWSIVTHSQFGPTLVRIMRKFGSIWLELEKYFQDVSHKMCTAGEQGSEGGSLLSNSTKRAPILCKVKQAKASAKIRQSWSQIPWGPCGESSVECDFQFTLIPIPRPLTTPAVQTCDCTEAVLYMCHFLPESLRLPDRVQFAMIDYPIRLHTLPMELELQFGPTWIFFENNQIQTMGMEMRVVVVGSWSH